MPVEHAVCTDWNLIGFSGDELRPALEYLSGVQYAAICGFKIHPHLLRHTMAKQFLKDTNNDLVALAQILGHENLNTVKIYSQRSRKDLAEIAEQLSY